jgi:hypothetical protein
MCPQPEARWSAPDWLDFKTAMYGLCFVKKAADCLFLVTRGQKERFSQEALRKDGSDLVSRTLEGKIGESLFLIKDHGKKVIRADLRTIRVFAVVLIEVAGFAKAASAQSVNSPAYLNDRGTGIPTSMFGTYVHGGELLLYPFFEFYLDNNSEYKPSELGYTLEQDFRGRYRAYEGLFFVGYGLTDWLAFELEAALISASLEKSGTDPSNTPARIEESGLGDVEAQLRLRWNEEAQSTPEIFSYFEAVAPLQKKNLLIGTQHWELKLGSGLVKGFSWGTMTFRAAAEYSVGESKFDLGEYAIEYLKRLSPAWRIYLGVEGTQDELELITEAQWHITDRMVVKINNALGITSKATDWAPEVGIMFSIPVP